MGKNKNLREDEAMQYFTMILIGLHYLHSKGIIHRDLKPKNIFVDQLSNGLSILKIGDFGIAKVDFQNERDNYSGTLASLTTSAYKAPEMLINDKNSSPKIDMWALGVILYQLVSSNTLPFYHENQNRYQIEKKIENEEPAPLKPSVSGFIREIIKQLLDKNPETRPDAKALIE